MFTEEEALNNRICRACNHLSLAHCGPGCEAEDCLCPGFALSSTREDRANMVNQGLRLGMPLEEVAARLGLDPKTLRAEFERPGG